jgi:hypothetical protein
MIRCTVAPGKSVLAPEARVGPSRHLVVGGVGTFSCASDYADNGEPLDDNDVIVVSQAKYEQLLAAGLVLEVE